MPLYEFECIDCRKGIEDSLNQIGKNYNKKTVSDLVKKYNNIYRIEVIDLEDEKVVADYGKRNKERNIQDFYLNEGSIAVLFNAESYRFAELIYDKDDEKKLKCPFCKTKKLEKVFSSFAFTSDLSTNMPKPDLSGLPPGVRERTMLGDYIEEKDRPKKNR